MRLHAFRQPPDVMILNVPTILMGFGLPDDRLHAPNEKFNISNFHNGIRAIVRLLDLAAEG